MTRLLRLTTRAGTAKPLPPLSPPLPPPTLPQMVDWVKKRAKNWSRKRRRLHLSFTGPSPKSRRARLAVRGNEMKWNDSGGNSQFTAQTLCCPACPTALCVTATVEEGFADPANTLDTNRYQVMMRTGKIVGKGTRSRFVSG